MNENPAYHSIRTKFVNNDYEIICETYGGDVDNLAAWRALGHLLAARTGWHFDFDLNHAEPTWNLGTLGESVLVLHVNQMGLYHCYDHRADDDMITADISTVERWIENREAGAQEPSEVLIDMARAHNWQTLKDVPITLRVSWSDGHFCATAYQLNEASFGKTLGEAVNGAGEMICRLIGAPVEIAREMNLSIELDVSAAARVRAT
ncbi:hypothetical protein [Streptomyces hydrogenans]|jgi:hypothetical protein|uniref:hypothetical protein n=1 Tax=Streptomyces hydrogenans TaxID=1873719 RepID=UPI0035E0B362